MNEQPPRTTAPWQAPPRHEPGARRRSLSRADVEVGRDGARHLRGKPADCLAVAVQSANGDEPLRGGAEDAHRRRSPGLVAAGQRAVVTEAPARSKARRWFDGEGPEAAMQVGCVLRGESRSPGAECGTASPTVPEPRTRRWKTKPAPAAAPNSFRTGRGWLLPRRDPGRVRARGTGDDRIQPRDMGNVDGRNRPARAGSELRPGLSPVARRRDGGQRPARSRPCAPCANRRSPPRPRGASGSITRRPGEPAL